MMIRTLEIVWEHSPELTEIPVITTDTNRTFCELLKDLGPAFETEGILLRFISLPLAIRRGVQNRVTLNGRALDDLLIEVAAEQRHCEGRRCEMSTPITFPVISHGDNQYQGVPDLIIRKVFLRASGII
jgi:hypothetical protein